jgi:hypothetical protein
MDVYQQYNKEVVGAPVVPSNAIDVIKRYLKESYDFIKNTLTNFPQMGDVILWTNGIGVYGHIAICLTADINHFICFEQNNPIGSLCHFGSHNYTNINGWLRPKKNISDAVDQNASRAIVEVTNQTLLDLTPCGEGYGKTEFQQVKAMLIAKDAQILHLEDVIAKYPQNVKIESKSNTNLLSQLVDLVARLVGK